MKTITLLFAILISVSSAYALTDTLRFEVQENPVIQVIMNENGDATTVEMGRRKIEVIESGCGHNVKFRYNRSKRRFPAHWQGIEFGVNMFHDSNYSLYDDRNVGDFFDLNYAKSITFNLNLFEYAFTNRNKTVGVVTGLGFSFMDFRFDNPLTITYNRDWGMVYPQNLDNIKKSKFHASYLTAPLMLEVVTPLRLSPNNPLTVAVGAIGGLNIGSRTKIKGNDGNKTKERRSFHVNPLKYDLAGRIGFGRHFGVFANYSMTSLFAEGKGPELYPLTVGISFH
ncbi:MAG: hypothetical protein FWG22_03600 [Prolixibacteraceae bacterium]|nr:hypothetical protein [Prolixibacteraceae bacterium]